jgi:DNA-binding NarL/FixJ family response regulator
VSDVEPIRALICDDHGPFREGMRALLTQAPDIELVAEAADGQTAVALADEHQPDVILMDLQMPGLNGIEATRRVIHTSPHIGVLVVSMFEDDESVFAAVQAGARGYLLKGARKAEVLRAIRSVAAGEIIFGPAIARRVLTYFAAPRAPGPAAGLPELTGREHEVLVLVEQHLTNPEIATRLGLRPKTVRNHISNIFTKLQVTDRTQAILRARAAGIGNSAPPPQRW